MELGEVEANQLASSDSRRAEGGDLIPAQRMGSEQRAKREACAVKFQISAAGEKQHAKHDYPESEAQNCQPSHRVTAPYHQHAGHGKRRANEQEQDVLAL